jgi:glucuronoarabinoxylan endo-1,4-beta-xylanase
VKGKLTISIGRVLLTATGLLGFACHADNGPQVGSQTNWLRACDRDADCGGSLTCQCGACTRSCDTSAGCDGLTGASCIASTDSGAIGYCSGLAPAAAGLCLPRCTDGSCPDGQLCTAGVCSPQPEPTTHVLIDDTVRHQSLTGFGATLAYAESSTLQHPLKSELFDAMFSNLGLDMVRLRNRYGHAGDDNLSITSEILALATDKLGRQPTVILTSWSPPPALKASGALTCQGNSDTCTLAKSTDGSFDYSAYAAYWRASLDAYANVGVLPDYIGIQNNPDYVPTSIDPGEGCKFLPVEGNQSVVMGGQSVAVSYPGLAPATAAVVDAMAGLAAPPKLVSPEGSSTNVVSDYVSALDMSEVAAIGHHLYGIDPSAVDSSAFGKLGALGRSLGKPLFQTEGQADGFGTAILMHYALVTEGASAYLQNVLVRPNTVGSTEPGTLIGLGTDDFTLEDPYHAMRHYALHTDPGWFRVDATSDASELLVSAWESPGRDSLTLVLINSSSSTLATTLDLGAFTASSSQVVRTVFDGVERSADLGSLSNEGVLRIPGRSIVTVALKT